MSKRIKQAFRKAYIDDQFQYSSLLLSPHLSRGYSNLALFIMVLGWVAFFTYIFVMVKVSDLSSFFEASLSPDADGIRYRALLFFTPLIFTVIGYLVNRNDSYFHKAIAYQERLEDLARTLETRIREQTSAIEESNMTLKAEMVEKSNALRSLLLLEKAFRTTQTGITIKDTDNIIRFINEADARMHGYEPSELIGKDAKVLASEGTTKKLDIEELKHISNWARESVNRRKDGGTFPVSLVSDVVLDDSGEPIGTVTTCEDISTLVDLREELKAANEEKERLTRALHQMSKDNIQA